MHQIRTEVESLATLMLESRFPSHSCLVLPVEVNCSTRKAICIDVASDAEKVEEAQCDFPVSKGGS